MNDKISNELSSEKTDETSNETLCEKNSESSSEKSNDMFEETRNGVLNKPLDKSLDKTPDETTIKHKIYPFTHKEIFKIVMQDKSIAAEIISIVLNRKVAEIENYSTEKDKKKTKDSHGVRYDLYFEGDSTVYNVEMQNSRAASLGRRCRYYQSLIDTDIFGVSEHYDNLKDSYIIFLCTFDPFGLARPIYTFESVCTDDGNCAIGDALKLDTGAKVVICNARAYNRADTDMRDFFEYLVTHKVAHKNAFVEKIDKAVQVANGNEEVRERIMIGDFALEDAKFEAKELGKEIGREEGIKWGEKKGRREGKREGRREGRNAERKRLVEILNSSNAGLTNEQREKLIKAFNS